MQIQGNANLAMQMEVVSAKLSQNQQEQQGQAVLQLLDATASPAPIGSSGNNVNTFA